MSTLSENLRNARLKAKKTQRQVADAVHCSSGAISHFETGRYVPNADTLQLIAEYLKTSVEELEKGGIPVSKVKRIRDDFPDLDERGRLLLHRIWNAVKEYTNEL